MPPSPGHGDCATERLAGAPASVLLVVAHPDDETIGFGAALGELWRAGARVEVMHVTDGAPRDSSLRPTLAHVSRAEAASTRRDEARAALAVQGISDLDRVLLPSLGVADQEAPQQMVHVARAIGDIIAGHAPAVVVTQPYEGGHPDHDAVAFATHAAVALARSRGIATTLAEMSSYHLGPAGSLVSGAFLSGDTAPRCGRSWSARLDQPARERKSRMLAAFASQASVLSSFSVEHEPVRCAPSYDFSRPPHEGALHYERLPFGWTCRAFLELARSAMRELER